MELWYGRNYVQFGVEGVKEVLHTCSHVDISESLKSLLCKITNIQELFIHLSGMQKTRIAVFVRTPTLRPHQYCSGWENISLIKDDIKYTFQFLFVLLRPPGVLQLYFNRAKVCLALSDDMSAHESCKLSAITVYYAITMILTNTCIPKTSAVHYSPSLRPHSSGNFFPSLLLDRG